METAGEILVLIAFLIVGVWVVGFGSAAALMAGPSDFSTVGAFTIGAAAGPAGLVIVWWVVRKSGGKSTQTSESEEGWSDSNSQWGSL